MAVNATRQKDMTQREFLILKDETKLEPLARIELSAVRVLDQLQEKGNEQNREKLARVWRGKNGNHLSVDVDSEDYAKGLGGCFDVIGFERYHAATAAWIVKDGTLTAYKVLDRKGIDKGADYNRTLEIANELSGELPTHQMLISALAQNEIAKKNVEGRWGYVKGKNEDLGNLNDGLYTWSDSKGEGIADKALLRSA